MTPNQLPPMPEPDTHCFDDDTGKDVWSYTADQMHAYALAALAQQAQGEPVYQLQISSGRWIDQSENQYNYNKAHESNVVRILYTTPQPAPQVPAPVDELVRALREINLASQNSMSGKEECGRIARAALSKPAPLAGEVTDEQIDALIKKHSRNLYSSSQLDWEVAEFHRFGLLQLIQSILALRPQAVPMTDDSQRLDWLAANPACTITEDSGLWFFDGHDYVGLREAIDAARGITAKAEGVCDGRST